MFIDKIPREIDNLKRFFQRKVKGDPKLSRATQELLFNMLKSMVDITIATARDLRDANERIKYLEEEVKKQK